MTTESRKCSATVHGERVQSWGCQRRGVVERDWKWYCRQHDPVEVEARRKARDDKFDANRRDSGVVYDEGRRLAKALGVEANVHYSSHGPFSSHGYTRHIVISFDDCRKLVDRLRER